MTPEEISARAELAAAFRWAARLGVHEGVCNHFSLMLPCGNRFLLNPHGLHFSEITASRLVTVDEGGVSVGAEEETEHTAFYIHSRIHRANPHARCILHAHPPYSTAIAMLEGGRLLPAHQNALRFYGKIAYDDDYDGLALADEEGDRMAAALSDKTILFLANHGVIVVGPTVAEAMDDLYFLERSCQMQLIAQSSGQPLRLIPGQIAERTVRQFDTLRAGNAQKHMAAIRRILDREEPDYTS